MGRPTYIPRVCANGVEPQRFPIPDGDKNIPFGRLLDLLSSTVPVQWPSGSVGASATVASQASELQFFNQAPPLWNELWRATLS